MLLSAILSYLPYSLATAFTPGPNNILALYSVSQKGWRGEKVSYAASDSVFSAS